MDKFALARLPNGRQVTYAYPDSHMMAAVCAAIFADGEYPETPFLDARVILDIGANIGCTSLLFAARYPSAIIYALEPASEAFSYLKRNTMSVPTVRAFHCGAFDRESTPILYLGGEASVTNSMTPNFFMGSRQERITLRRFSTFLQEQSISHISILKLDTEGAELAILRDIATMFDAPLRVDCMMIEYHSEADRLAVDQMMKRHYTLYASRACNPHRGTNTYVAKSIIAARTRFDEFAIVPRAEKESSIGVTLQPASIPACLA